MSNTNSKLIGTENSKPYIPFLDRLAASVEDVAEAFDVSKPTVQAAINSGELPSFRIGRRRLVRPKAAEAYVKQLEVKNMAALEVVT